MNALKVNKKYKKIKFWILALLGPFQSSLSQKPSEIEEICRHIQQALNTINSKQKKHIKIGWIGKFLSTLQKC